MANLKTPQDELKEAREMLRRVLPASSLDLLTYAVTCLIETDERKAVAKIIEHFFTKKEEREAFMYLVNAHIVIPEAF